MSAADDLAPVSRQDWGWFDFLSFWMSDVHSIGGYVMAGALFALGLPPAQIFASLVTGSLLVCVCATLVAVPSQKMGVPFAIVVRRAFGRRAGLIPAAIRAAIAMAWYGIQTWLASNAVCLLLIRLFPGLAAWADCGRHGALGLSLLGWVCFLTLWAGQMLIFRCGIEAVRRFFDLAGPAVYGVMLALLAYLLWCNHWRWPGLFHRSSQGRMWAWINATALVVSYFSGPMLNFGDFARKGRNMRQIAIGNFLGLPVNFVFFAALSVATTALTLPVLGAAMDDPVTIVGHIRSPAIVAIAILTFLVATAGINIAANFVSGALDLCALAPNHLTLRRSGWIFGLGAIALTPWNLYNDPARMHATLDILAAAVGPIFGILIAEYYIVADRYPAHGASGLPALIAMAQATILALLPEFFARFSALHSFSWFIGVFCAGGVYVVLMFLRCVYRRALESR